MQANKSKQNNNNDYKLLPVYRNITKVPRQFDSQLRFHNIYSHFQTKAQQAALAQKVFTIYGRYITIRNELKKRGWLEKCAPNYLRNLQNISLYNLITNARNGNDYETMALSKLLESFPIKFFWLARNGKSQKKHYFLPYVNIIRRNGRLDFTTKYGLIGCIENSHWNIIDGIAEINVPRYHRLQFNAEHIEFLEDYRTTYCLSLLQYIRESKNYDDIFHECGTIPIKIVDFALCKIRNELANRNCDDIVNNAVTLTKKIENINMEWMTFYYHVNHLVNCQNKIELNSSEIDILKYIQDCNDVMKEADKYWPQIQSDGYNNLWIIKPAFACRGWGITIKNNFENILGYISRRNKIRYIVQKYIERPLLIYNTKFDIRQYILLTITESRFNIWMYKDCYLRFSSQEYKLTNLAESVHITNNAIQRKYKNGKRNSELPVHNMWSLREFQNYLINIGKPKIWNEKIYSGMKKNIIAVILASLEETDICANLFEIYGCDFMLNENYEPILIEINSTPDMTSSTIVTAKICPTVLADVIKVIVDLPKNRKALIGQFELVYSIPYTPGIPKTSSSLEIVGKRLRANTSQTK